jgi:hypothetical protein
MNPIEGELWHDELTPCGRDATERERLRAGVK